MSTHHICPKCNSEADAVTLEDNNRTAVYHHHNVVCKVPSQWNNGVAVVSKSHAEATRWGHSNQDVRYTWIPLNSGIGKTWRFSDVIWLGKSVAQAEQWFIEQMCEANDSYVEPYYLMDGRANFDLDRAFVLESCKTLDEAIKNIGNHGADTCIVYNGEVLWSLTWGAATELKTSVLSKSPTPETPRSGYRLKHDTETENK